MFPSHDVIMMLYVNMDHLVIETLLTHSYGMDTNEKKTRLIVARENNPIGRVDIHKVTSMMY